MKIIIKDFNNKVYNLNLTTEQVDFAKWLANHNALYSIKITRRNRNGRLSNIRILVFCKSIK